MMNQKKEQIQKIILIGMGVVLMLGLAYYFGFYRSTEHLLNAYDTVELEEELLLYQTRAHKLRTMEKELEESKEKNIGVMQPYNSLQKEITELNRVFEDVKDYQFNFSEPTYDKDNKIIRRDISITFHTTSYKKAKEIIEELYTFRYKSKIHGISMTDSSSEAGIKNTKDIDVGLQVTLYETVLEGTNVSGLQKYQSKDTQTNNNSE